MRVTINCILFYILPDRKKTKKRIILMGITSFCSIRQTCTLLAVFKVPYRIFAVPFCLKNITSYIFHTQKEVATPYTV